ncbi:acetyl-CoA carboxylase biotin carboxylase subunit family protein [Streptomyces sp. NPDC051218]|uniref:acetyl-CoA carboxylase biotin carboxylase subunit family protein n=1 Tax=Streptomyces sp. NPDC051218 TaxID=3365645 RepID=UPI0037A719DD
MTGSMWTRQEADHVGKRLLVVYDKGAVGPYEIARSLSDMCEITFLVPESKHNSRVLPLLGQLADVVRLDDDVRDVRRHLDRLRPDGITTFCESRLLLTAALADYLGLPYHDLDTVQLLRNKHRQRERLRTHGVDNVRNAFLSCPEDWDDAVARTGIPAVLKPVDGEGSRHTTIVHDASTGQRLLQELLAVDGNGQRREQGMVLEELLVGRDMRPFGDYVSVECLVSRGQVHPLMVTGKLPFRPPFRELAHIWPAPLDDADRKPVLDLCIAALTALGVRQGLTHVEIKLTESGPRLIEVNGRLGAYFQEMSWAVGGPNLVQWAGRLAFDEDVRSEPLAFDKVVFAHFEKAPDGATAVLSATGATEVRKLPGCRLYRPCATVGPDPDGDMSMMDLDLFCGVADDYDEMFAMIAEVQERAKFTFAFDAEATATPSAGH